MKKTLFLSLIFAFCFSTINISAQQVKLPNRIFKKGQMDVHANLGVVPTFPADNAKTLMAPIAIGSDYYISNAVSLGVTFGHSISKSKMKVIEDGLFAQFKTSYTEIGIKAGLHITRFEDIDIVTGLALNYAMIGKDPLFDGLEDYMMHNGIEKQSNKFVPSAYLGVNYAISKKVSLRSEFGLGLSLFKIGVGYKIK